MGARPPLLPAIAGASAFGVLVAFSVFLGAWDGLLRVLRDLYADLSWVELSAPDPAFPALWALLVAVALAAVGGMWGVSWGARLLFLFAASLLLASASLVLASRGWLVEPASALLAACGGFFFAAWIRLRAAGSRRGSAPEGEVREAAEEHLPGAPPGAPRQEEA